MAVTNLKSRQGTIFIPTESNVYCKIIITDDNDTDYTVMNTYSGLESENYVVEAPTIRNSATDALGSFQIKIANDGGRFLNVFDGGEEVKVYADYTDATTLIFSGKIDDVKYGLNLSLGFFVELSGRNYPELIDKTITGVEVASRSDTSIARIIYNNYDTNELAYQFWDSTTSTWCTAAYNPTTESVTWSPAEPNNYPSTLINMTYQHKKGWSVITEILSRAGIDCYIDYDTTYNAFVIRGLSQGDIVNEDSNIAYGVNLIGIAGFGLDTGELINSVIVYGKTESDNILLLKTKEDADSQSNFWIKEKIVNAGSLTTMTDVEEKADYELSKGLAIQSKGTITTLCMPTLRPGDTIQVSVPYCNISGSFIVSNFTHKFGTPFTTDITLSDRSKVFSELFSEKADPEEFIGNISNPNAMTNSYTVYFNESPSVMTHSSTEESYGVLRLSGTNVSGTATSDFVIADDNVTSCELRTYENFQTEDDVYYVTNDGGVTWEEYDHEPGVPHTFTSTGRTIGFRIELNRDSSDSVSPAYESISLLYK